MPDLKSKCCNQEAVLTKHSLYFCAGVNGCGLCCEVVEIIDEFGENKPLSKKSQKILKGIKFTTSEFTPPQDMKDSADFSNFAQRIKMKWWNKYEHLFAERYIDELLQIAWGELKDRNIKKIKDLITEEINICHQEGTPTSRLTSLYNKIEGL